MPISFAIPFGGSEINLIPPIHIHPSALSFSRRRHRQHTSTSTSTRSPFNPTGSGSSTRYATLSNSNALRLRQRAFASSNGGSSRRNGGGMFLLHLSMLTLLPILFDSAHGQSAYGYKRGLSSSTSNRAAEEQEVAVSESAPQVHQKETEEAALLLSEHLLQPQLFPAFPASIHATTSALWRQAQMQNASAGPSHTRSLPISQAAGGIGDTMSPPKLVKSSKAKGKGRAAPDPTPDSMLALQRDLTQKLQELIVEIQGDEVVSIGTYHTQIERLEQLMSLAHGIATLDDKLDTSAFASVGPDLAHSLVTATTRTVRDLQHFLDGLFHLTDYLDTEEDTIWAAQKAVVVVRDRFCELLVSLWRSSYRRRRVPHSLDAETCQYVLQDALGVRYDGGLYTQDQPDLRMAVTAWLLLQSAQCSSIAAADTDKTSSPASMYQQPEHTTDQLAHLSNLIIHTLRHEPVRACSRTGHGLKQYMDAIAAYTALFESLRRGEIGDPASYATILETGIRLPHPPRKAPSECPSAASKIPAQSACLGGCAPPRLTNLAVAQTQHAYLFEATHSFFRNIIVGVLEGEAGGAETSKKIVYCERHHIWSIVDQRTDAAGPSREDNNNGAEQKRVAQQICSDARALHILMKYAFAHLRSWEIGESLYRFRAEGVLGELLERCRRGSSAWWSPLRLEAEKIARQIEVLRLRSATLLRVPQQTLMRVASVALHRVAVCMGLREPEDDVLQLSWQPSVEEMRWQVDCLLCTPTFWPATEMNHGDGQAEPTAAGTADDRYEMNDAIVAFLALWTATSQWEIFRLFVDRFFAHRSRSREPVRPRHEDVQQNTQSSFFSEEEEQTHHSSLTDSDSDSVGSLTSSRDYAHSDGSSSDNSIELDSDIASGRAWLNSQAVRAAMDRWTSSPAILVAMLNGASKYGNPSLTEKVWLAACEEETYRTERAQWRGVPRTVHEREDGRSASTAGAEAPGDEVWNLPLAAYTCMMQTYAEEARKENVAMRTEAAKEQGSARKRGFAADLNGDLHDGKHSAKAILASRTTEYYRDQLRLDGVRASMHLASQTYTRLRDTQPGLVPDARFFNAAVSVFARCSPIPEVAATAGRAVDRQAALEKLERQATRGEIVPSAEDRTLSLVMRDITNAGVDVPIMLLAHVKPAHTGWLGFRPQVFDRERDVPPLPYWGEKLDHARSPLLEWLRPIQTDESSRLYVNSRPRDRGLIPIPGKRRIRSVL